MKNNNLLKLLTLGALFVVSSLEAGTKKVKKESVRMIM